MSSLRRVLLVSVLVLCSAESWAREPAKLTATFYADSGGKVHVRTVAEALERALSRLARIDLKPIRHLLEPVHPQVEMLAKANEAITAGQDLMNNLEVQQALAAFERAAKLQRRAFHLMAVSESGIEEHGKVFVEMTIAHFLAGDEQKARQALQQAFVLNPKQEFDERKFPPQTKRMFDEVKFLIDELGSGSARIETVPAGSELRINGNFVGYSPVTTRGIAAGPNLITASRIGYNTRTSTAQISGGDKTDPVKLTLRPVKGNPAAMLATAVAEARSGRPGGGLASLAGRLQRRVLFLATTVSRDDLVTVNLYAYDAKGRRISSATTGTVSALDPDHECKNLAQSMAPFLTWHPPKQVVKRHEGWWQRFRASPYFWPAVGAAATVVVGTTVGLGVYYETRDDDHRGRNLLLLPVGL